MKIVVLAYQSQLIFARVLPDRDIGSTQQADVADMEGAGIDVSERCDKTGRQIFVEKEPGRLNQRRRSPRDVHAPPHRPVKRVYHR